MIPFEIFLSITGPITANEIGVTSEGRAMAGIAGEDSAQIFFGVTDDQNGQIVIDRAPSGPAIGSKIGAALGPKKFRRLACRESFQGYFFESIDQFAGVLVDVGLVFGRNGLDKERGQISGDTWSGVGM